MTMTRKDALKWASMGGASLALAGMESPAAMAETAARKASGANKNEAYVMVSNVAANAYWNDAQDGGRDAAAELGVTWQYTGPAKFDTPAQVTALEQIIGTKPAGILVAALQPDLLTASINKAVRAGIPVVTVDTDAPASLRATYLGTNNYQAGLIMGQQIVKVLKGKGKVGLASVPGQFNLDERIRGIKDVFKQNPGVQLLTVVDDKNDEGATATAVAALIQSHPDINLVACMNAVGAGVAAALRQTSNVGKIHAVLFDKNAPILAAVKDGTADSTLVQRTYMMAYLGVKLLYAAKHPSPYLANWQKHGIVILPNGVDTGVMPVSRSLAGAFA